MKSMISTQQQDLANSERRFEALKAHAQKKIDEYGPLFFLFRVHFHQALNGFFFSFLFFFLRISTNRANQGIEKSRDEFQKEVSALKLQLKKAELEAKAQKVAAEAKVRHSFSFLFFYVSNTDSTEPAGARKQGAYGDL